MKKAILLSDWERIKYVYSPEVLEILSRESELDRGYYTHEDLKNDPEKFKNTEIIFSTWGMPALTEDEISEFFPKLECLFYAAGSVQRFARPFLNKGVKVFSAWAANGIPVAEYTVSQILLANKGFFRHSYLLKNQRHGEYEPLKKIYPGNYNANVGLIGCGMIGSLVSEMLKNYKLNVYVYDPYLSDEKAEKLNVIKCTLEEIFSECDVVSNHLPDIASTKKLIKYDHFKSMKPYATFINTGRGAQLDESELAAALSERPDLTAILDVTVNEPPLSDSPFYTLPNCILTPHIAGSLSKEVVRMSEYMADEFIRYKNGEKCLYEVDMKMLETMA